MKDSIGLSLVLQGVATIITAVGVILIALVKKQSDTIAEKVVQVEKQGNSVSLELKRTNMVYARRLADATKDPGDIFLAEESQKAHEEAVRQNARL